MAFDAGAIQGTIDLDDTGFVSKMAGIVRTASASAATVKGQLDAAGKLTADASGFDRTVQEAAQTAQQQAASVHQAFDSIGHIPLDPSGFDQGMGDTAAVAAEQSQRIADSLAVIQHLLIDHAPFDQGMSEAAGVAAHEGEEIHESLSNAGHLDLDHTSFDNGIHEAFTHSETEGGRIREAMEAIAESMQEIVGPAAAQMAQQIQSALAGFSEGPAVGVINAVGVALGGVREATESSGEQFRAMSLAAERAGVSVEWMSRLAAVGGTVGVGLDQLQMGFRILEERAGEAHEGNKTAIEDFQRLGISAAEAGSLMGQPAELFSRVQKGIEGISNASERTTAALGVLGGRGGSFLVPLLNLSGSEFDETADRAQRFGAIVDEQRAKQGEAWDRIEQDAVQAMTGIRNAVSQPVLDYLEDHMAEIEPRVESMVGAVKEAITTAWSDVSQASAQVAPDLETIAAGLEQALHAAEPLAKAMASISAKAFQDVAAVLKELTPDAVSAVKSLADLAVEVAGPLKTAFEAIEPLIQHAGAGLKDLIADANVAIKTIAGLDTSKDKGGGVTGFVREYMPHVVADYDAVRDRIIKLHEQHAFSGEVADLGYNPYDPKSPVPKKIGDDSGVTIDHVHIGATQDASGLTIGPESSTPQLPVPRNVAPSSTWTPLSPDVQPAATPAPRPLIRLTPSPLDFLGLPPIVVPPGEVPLQIPQPATPPPLAISAPTVQTPLPATPPVASYATPIPAIEPETPATGRTRRERETGNESSERSRRPAGAANASESTVDNLAGPLGNVAGLLGQANAALQPMPGSLTNFRQAVDDAAARMGDLFSAAARAVFPAPAAAPAAAAGVGRDATAPPTGSSAPTVNQTYTVNVQFDPRESINQFVGKVYGRIAEVQREIDARLDAAAAHGAAAAGIGGGH